ncbi:8526_t:CDS:2, partial [Cetraspora pellucida]
TYDPTLEDSYRKQVVIDDESCVLEILDQEYTPLYDQLYRYNIHNIVIAFPKKYKSKNRSSEFDTTNLFLFREADGFLLVYSISSRSTVELIDRFYDNITRVRDTEPIPVILVGNKCDQRTMREVSREEGMNMARRLKCDFIESSAKTAVN